jgi:hypothetical protein
LSLAPPLCCHLGHHLSLGSSHSAPSTHSLMASLHLAAYGLFILEVFQSSLDCMPFIGCIIIPAPYLLCKLTRSLYLIFIQIVAVPFTRGSSATSCTRTRLHIMCSLIFGSRSDFSCVCSLSFCGDAPYVHCLLAQSRSLHTVCAWIFIATSSREPVDRSYSSSQNR